ncbi:hypothetical protein GCK32_007204 [Trichostrongylus colubriformis]|uniref:Uncharacterized protein n=1 Tax=Trichostrongylus colubriformis TaxID=6319 RepID=A0AAN8FKQ4_TRICO
MYVYMYFVYENDSTNVTSSSSPLKLTDKEIARAFIKTYGRFRVLEDSVCLEDGKTCVKVLDNVRKTKNGRYYFYRSVYYDAKEVTSMNLKIPDVCKITPNGLVRSLNPFNGSYSWLHRSQDVWLLIRVEMSHETAANVLSIGLGAGYLNSYLHSTYSKMNITVVEIEPKMVEIAHKWFDLEEDDLHRVFTMDGVEFLKEAAEKGQKFDVVHVDACDSDSDADVNCPVAVFLGKEVVKSIHKVLSNKGVLIMNLLSLKLPQAKVYEKVLDIYGKVFRNCFIIKVVDSPPNMVMTCSDFDRVGGLKAKYDRFLGVVN